MATQRRKRSDQPASAEVAKPAPQPHKGEPTPRRTAPARATSAARQDIERQQPSVAMHYEESYQGPVPPPDMLREYDYVVPGSAARIIDSAMGQTAHRQAQENKVINGSERRADRGQWIGALLLIVAMSFGLVIALSISAVAGAGVITSAVVGGALVFIIGGRPPKESTPELPQPSERDSLPPGAGGS